jgi:hypothetical protein
VIEPENWFPLFLITLFTAQVPGADPFESMLLSADDGLFARSVRDNAWPLRDRLGGGGLARRQFP